MTDELKPLVLALDEIRTQLHEHCGGRPECVHCRIFDHVNAAYGEAIGEPIENTRSTSLSDEALVEPVELVERLRGRAAFLRDRGEVKTPELLEEAIEAIASSDTTLITALREAHRDMAAMLDRIESIDECPHPMRWHDTLAKLDALSNQPGERGG